MGIINRIFGKKKFQTSIKRDDLKKSEDRLKENTLSTIETPVEEPSENSLRIKFFKAIEKGEVENVKAALEAGADPNCIIENEFELYPGGFPQYHGQVPLIAAASLGNAEIVKILLDTGAYPKLRVNAALMEAAASGKVEAVKILLGAGADPNYRDRFGRDALISAALRLDSEYCDPLPVIDILLKSGADPNHTENNGQSAISLAAYYNHVEAIKMMLKNGLFTEPFNLKKALDWAKKNGNQEVFDLINNLIEKVQSEKKRVTAETTTDSREDTTTEKTIYFGEMMPGKTVDVIVSVEGYIHGSDSYGGKYHAKLPLDMVSTQLLNHIADKIGVIRGFHMGYMLLLKGETILTCREKKTLRDTGVKNGDTLTFIDWG